VDAGTPRNTQSVLSAAATDCLLCAQNGSDFDPTCDITSADVNCEGLATEAERNNCLDTLACALPPGAGTTCVVTDTNALTVCYCGTTSTSDCLGAGVPNGVCQPLITAGFPAGSTQSFIGTNLANPMFSAGRAMALTKCIGQIKRAIGAGDPTIDAQCASCY
jgi:hypothetical protein